jgi:CHASE3 domain sensor protein
MHAWMRELVRGITAGMLALVFMIPQDAVAQSHVVSPAELQSAAAASSAARERNIEALQQFVSTPMAEKALKSAHVDAQQVKQAVSRLDDQELARLASRANKAQADFAAGTLSDRDLIIILVCVAALILIIVAVR